ncbi:sec-independent translocase [Microlunatus kandeliicorticis]|uniref:sec-independent translocase n=1 Tax=Microlunatus kandeliicorticis TaxID=1759536 RepID=UPI0015F8E0B9|nr:sec-independent translocase [Microlunatus kandeliicorticis]
MLDIGAPEFLVLAVIAVILFGPERLPQLARKAAQVLAYVRQMAGSAQTQLRDELGPGFEDFDFTDLSPKAFVRKHLLEDVEPIVADVRDELGSLRTLGRESADDLTDKINSVKAITPGGPGDVSGSLNGSSANGSALNGSAGSRLVLTPFDPDAT